MRIDTIDLHFQGTPHVIAAFLVRSSDGAVLIETGPASTLPALIDGLERLGVRPEEIDHLLVTHIHLDHAGAAGWWARQGTNVHVHPVGAPHLVDPSRLLSSAARIYGDRMEALWGEILPAPAERVHPVEDGAVLTLAGLEIEAIATPGHANHHHVYRIGEVAFSGDAVGIRLPGADWIDLPAPPPEFDLQLWRESLTRLRSSGIRTLYRTHFGAGGSDDADRQLATFERVLEKGSEAVRTMLDDGIDREQMIDRFTELMRDSGTRSGLSAADLLAYELANPRQMSVDGIARYWRKPTRLKAP